MNATVDAGVNWELKEIANSFANRWIKNHIDILAEFHDSSADEDSEQVEEH